MEHDEEEEAVVFFEPLRRPMVDLFVGQLVMYYHPDEPEGGMVGTILSIREADPPPDDMFGRSIMLELHNWGDKAASECDVFPIYTGHGDRATMQYFENRWQARYEMRKDNLDV